jgi:hypothetical protein
MLWEWLEEEPDGSFNGQREFCHDEMFKIHWSMVEGGTLVCKGNLHICKKMKLRWLASLPQNKRDKYLELGYL